MEKLDNSNDAARNNFPLGDGDDMERRLWDYIDDISNETALIEKLIAENVTWRAKYAQLLEVHQVLHHTELEEPSLRFTKNVMVEIARLQITPAAKQYIDTKIIWGIVAFFIIAIVGFLVFGFSQMEWSAASSSGKGVDSNFTAVNYSKFFNNTFINLFMMLNVVLGLMLLDRYLDMKKNVFTKK